jgi:PAS domain S-box-containing protein
MNGKPTHDALEKRYRSLFDDALDMIHIVDSEGRIIDANPIELKTLGYTKEEFIGMRLTDLIHPDHKAITSEAFSRLIEGEKVQGYETCLVARDGREIDVEVRAVPLFEGDSVFIQAIIHDISERKKTTEVLFENERMLQGIFRAAPVGIGMVSDRVLLWANDKLQELTGYKNKEMLGRSSRILYPNDREYEWVGREKYLQIEKNGTGVVETKWQRKNGEIIEVMLSSSPLDREDVSKGVIFTALDITDRKYAEQALYKSREMYRSLVENIDLGVTLIDKEHTVVMANKAQGEILGVDPHSFIGKKCFHEFEKREHICPHCPGVKAMATAQPQEAEAEGMTDAGNITVHIRAFPVMNEDGQVEGFIEVVEDITDQKRVKEEKEKMEKQLQNVQKLESLGVLAGGIAHDFNNLLMAILGNAELALMQLSQVAPGRENIEDIVKVSTRAADLCKQMLAYSGKGKFVVEPLDLAEVVREITHMMEISISKKSLLKLNLAENLPAVMADATQMRQVIMNMVINASEAIGDVSGVISISAGAMECDRSYLRESYLDEELEEGLYCYLEVSDTGSGMDEETLARIFDPFYTSKFTGRGLGLAAVLGIVRGHRGAIKVSSEMGKGTNFKILFPACDSVAAQRQRIEEELHPLWQGSGTILLVDDEETVRSVGKRMLEMLGFEVLVAEDGQQAVKIFREKSASIACLLLDLTMPHLDGEQTFREIRRIQKDVRIIMCSGYNEQDISQRFIGKKLTGFIQKPYQLASLSEVLQRAFAEGGTPAPHKLH